MIALRWLSLLPLGIVLTLGLLWFISELIQTQPEHVHTKTPVISLSFLNNSQLEEEAAQKKEILEEKKELAPQEVFMPEMTLALADLRSEISEFSLPSALPEIDLTAPITTEGLQIDNSRATTATANDRELTAIRENALSYPQMARRKRLEGWVTFNYMVNKEGKVLDIEIVESSPPRVFDRVVLKEVSKWRYLPRLEKGQAVATRVVERKYVFEL